MPHTLFNANKKESPPPPNKEESPPPLIRCVKGDVNHQQAYIEMMTKVYITLAHSKNLALSLNFNQTLAGETYEIMESSTPRNIISDIGKLYHTSSAWHKNGLETPREEGYNIQSSL